MKMLTLILTLFIFCSLSLSQDVAGSKDHPMFNRISGFYIEDYKVEEFASFNYWDENGLLVVEGKQTYIRYRSESGLEVPKLKVIRNFVNAIKDIGGKAFEESDHSCYLSIKQGNMETYANVYAGGYYYYITILEKGEVEQEITANSILKELNETGKAILYINFDSGKATIKQESIPIVEQIIEMMKQAKDIKLSVEGHTDSDGSNESNQKLSEARAKSVVEAIVKSGIDASRLSSAGFGEEKPIADNSTSEGKAKNRRVELIKK